MSLRPGKQSEKATQVEATSDSSPELSHDEDRIFSDTSNVAALKVTCDEAVERILTRTSNPLAPAPSASPLASNAPSTEDVTQAGLQDGPNATETNTSTFPPFKVSHLHTDLRLLLGYLGALSIIGVSLWSYFIEKSWQLNKGITAIAVVFYLVVSALQTLDAYIQGDNIFTGKRKTLSNRIETEHLNISSPALPKATLSASMGPNGKKIITPPVYSLKVDYTRTSNGGKSLIRRAQDTVKVGHFGEWFTEEGEFVEELFEERLIGALNEIWDGRTAE